MTELAKLSSSATAALAWWIVPIVGVTGAIIYVIWLAKYKDRYENTTHRSLNSFSRFQNIFRNDQSSKQTYASGRCSRVYTALLGVIAL